MKVKMKSINKILLVCLLAVGTAGTFISCSKDDSANGIPSIKYVRITRPESSDSLLIGAGQGQLIAIVGDNLKEAVQVWFNDQQARLTPTYITNTSLLVVVPSQIPIAVTNKVKLIFKNGFQLLYNFQVQISKPLIYGMNSEFVRTGDVATIRGNYFYNPLTVKFAGGVTGNIVSVNATNTEIQVTVPAGALPGQIQITTKFGTSKSDFFFRD